jgi:uncharacterized membrane protein YhaH (DUF805 family)
MDIDWGNFLFSFNGRLNRAKYWLWVLIYVVVAIVVGVIVYAIDAPMITGILNFAVGIALLVSGLAIATKRLHDRGKSAWWLLVFYLVPGVLIGVGVGLSLGSALSGGDSGLGIMGYVLSLAGLAIVIWAFIELGCLRGTVGPNQYGPDPLDAALAR